MPKVTKEFIKNFPDYNRGVLQLLYNRELKDMKEIDNFFSDNLEFHNPSLLKNLEKAVDLLIKNIKEGNKIVVYGDYDADGVTASALMTEILRLFKADVDIYIPERVSEGYGLNKNAIDFLAGEGVKLILTVDCGIRNREEVNYAKELGIEIIVTDHHVLPDNKKDLPDCLVVNPLLGDSYPFKFLSGVGVAYKVALKLIEKSKLEDIYKKRLGEQMLDLVAIGTVADCVSLLGENRNLVKKGLEALNNTKRSGLVKLMNEARIKKGNLSSWNISFQIAPRLNAAGRMDHANTSFELLTTKDEEEARDLAKKLNSHNVDRQNNTEEIMKEVEKQIGDSSDELLIGLYELAEDKESEIWNEGVIGLVAGKICEKYYRPVLIITRTKEGYKGSGRSIPEFDMIEAIEKFSDILEKYGGHPMACGFSVSSENLEKFREGMLAAAKEKLKKVNLEPRLSIEAELKSEDIDDDLVEEVLKFEPFGKDNERPRFVSYRLEILDIINMGLEAQHIKLRLRGTDSRIINAVGFGQSEKWSDLRIGDFIDIVYYLEFNEFNGNRNLQLKIIDIKLSD